VVSLVGCAGLYITTARPLFHTLEARIFRCLISALHALFALFPATAPSERLSKMKAGFTTLREKFEMYYDIYTEREAVVGAMFRSIVGFLQVVGNVGKLIRWPPEFIAVTGWFAFFKVSFDVPTVGCVVRQVFEYTFYDRLLLYCLAPFAVIAVLNLPLAWARLRRLPTALRDDVRIRCIHWTLRVLFFVYPMVSQLVISALVCKQLGPDLWLLSYDYRVDCRTARYEEFKKFALAMLVVWVIAYPLSMLIVMKVYKVPEMAARKQSQAAINALYWHTLKLHRGLPGQGRSPHQQGGATATPELPGTSAEVPEPLGTAAAVPEPPAGAHRLQNLTFATLFWLCKTNGLQVAEESMRNASESLGSRLSSPSQARRDVLVAALETFLEQLIDSEELAVPKVKWDPKSADEVERRACAEIGSLFDAYEPEWWWYASSIDRVGPTQLMQEVPFARQV